jgi:NIPSNAP
MFIDHRTYTLKPGAVGQYMKIYQEKGLPVQTKHLGQPIGWFYTEIGPLNQIIHMWGYKDLEERSEKRANMQADPAWGAFLKEARELIVSMENKILLAAPYSPIK